MSYSLILSSGKSFTGLEANGDYFETASPLAAEDFSGLMSRVSVVDNGNNDGVVPPVEAGIYTDLEVCHIFSADGKSYVCLKHKDTSEADALRDRADIEYLAMMTGVEL